MPITQYTGKILLQQETLAAIQKETASLFVNKDVAGAYVASKHIKSQLAALPQADVAPLLPAYRMVTSKLKALALPVLMQEDVAGLLANNLEFLDTQSEVLLVSGLNAWLAGQPDEAQEGIKADLRSRIDKESPFASKLLAVLADTSTGSPSQSASTTPSRPDEVLDASERADLSKSARKAQAVVGVSSNEGEAQSLSRTIFSFSGSKTGEEAFVRRSQALIRSRLRDIRTAAEFADYAGRPFATGGLGLTGEALSRAERVVSEAYGRVHGIAPSVPVAPKAPPPQPVAESQLQKSAPQPQAPEKPKSDSQKEIDKLIKSDAQEIGLADLLKGKQKTIPEPAAPKPPQPFSQSAPVAAKPPLPTPTTPVASPRPPEPRQEQLAPRRAAPSTKPRMDDVTVARTQEPVPSNSRRSMGLSDELGTITLADFRGLGGSANSIASKIATLEGDSITQKLEGIRAFRTSPLFAAYLAIGDASLSGGKKLAEVLADPTANPEHMTEDEFFSIADLASKLK